MLIKHAENIELIIPQIVPKVNEKTLDRYTGILV